MWSNNGIYRCHYSKRCNSPNGPIVMQGNTATKRQSSGNGSFVPTKKRVIRGTPPVRNQGEKPGNSGSNIPPHYKMPTTIFLNAPIKIYEF